MHFWPNNGSIVTDPATAQARARAGAAWLDQQFGPGWDQHLDLDRLDIGSPFSCVLAQLWWRGVPLDRLQMRYRAYVHRGFSSGLLMDFLTLAIPIPSGRRSYALLTAAWKEIIRERRGRRLLEDLASQIALGATRSARQEPARVGGCVRRSSRPDPAGQSPAPSYRPESPGYRIHLIN